MNWVVGILLDWRELCRLIVVAKEANSWNVYEHFFFRSFRKQRKEKRKKERKGLM